MTQVRGGARPGAGRPPISIAVAEIERLRATMTWEQVAVCLSRESGRRISKWTAMAIVRRSRPAARAAKDPDRLEV